MEEDSGRPRAPEERAMSRIGRGKGHRSTRLGIVCGAEVVNRPGRGVRGSSSDRQRSASSGRARQGPLGWAAAISTRSNWQGVRTKQTRSAHGAVSASSQRIAPHVTKVDDGGVVLWAAWVVSFRTGARLRRGRDAGREDGER